MHRRAALGSDRPKGFASGALLLILFVALGVVGTAQRCELTCEDRAYNDCVEEGCGKYKNTWYYAECVDDCDKYAAGDCID